MLNEEKVKLMTKLAIYEQKEGRQDLPLSKYYKTDYLTLKMINSAIAMTVGYIVLVITILLVNVEELLAGIVSMDIMSLGRILLFFYAVLFVVNMVVTYFVYSYKFKKSRKHLNKYNDMLKELYTLYKQEEKTSKNNFFEDDFDLERVSEDEYFDDMADFGGMNDDEAFDD